MADPFIPIDVTARNGTGYLIRTEDGSLHAASFIDGIWCYSGDPQRPVQGEVTAYRPRFLKGAASCTAEGKA